MARQRSSSRRLSLRHPLSHRQLPRLRTSRTYSEGTRRPTAPTPPPDRTRASALRASDPEQTTPATTAPLVVTAPPTSPNAEASHLDCHRRERHPRGGAVRRRPEELAHPTRRRPRGRQTTCCGTCPRVTTRVAVTLLSHVVHELERRVQPPHNTGCVTNVRRAKSPPQPRAHSTPRVKPGHSRYDAVPLYFEESDGWPLAACERCSAFAVISGNMLP